MVNLSFCTVCISKAKFFSQFLQRPGIVDIFLGSAASATTYTILNASDELGKLPR